MVDITHTQKQLIHRTGYASPKEAFKNGPREKLLYVCCPSAENDKRPDCLVTVDVDPNSPTYSSIIHILRLPNLGDELHHMGWNACSSCFHQSCHENLRRFIILPGMISSRIYIIDTFNEREPKIHKIIEPEQVLRHGIGFPHTVHCLADGNIMISMLGKSDGSAGGGFLLLNKNFDVVGRWNKEEEEKLPFSYDFWYQPRQNIMISSEWGTVNNIKQGFKLEDVTKGAYGKTLHFWDWKQRKLLNNVELQDKIPLEVRFLHNPDSKHGFVNTLLNSSIVHFFKDDNDGEWKTERVIETEPIKVEGWIAPDMPSLTTDILISMDDKYLYFGNWAHGDIRQYDITDPHHPKLTGQLFVGGLIRKGGTVTVSKDDKHGAKNVDVPDVKGVKLQGGPQMFQLSLDGKRLYLTSSLYNVWDKQFYPDMVLNGSQMLLIDVDTEKGGLKLNKDFLIDFGKAEGGPLLAHEARYPGGDCSSDIWI